MTTENGCDNDNADIGGFDEVQNPFPYKNPLGYDGVRFDLYGDEDTLASLFQIAGIVLGIYSTRFRNHTGFFGSGGVRLDSVVFRLCLDFAAKRLSIIRKGEKSDGASISGHVEWPHIDNMILFGAELGATVVRFRPLQFGSDPPQDEPILLHINELFALEFGWVVSNWMIRHRDNAEFFHKGCSDKLGYIIRDIMMLRSMGRKAQNMFQYHVTEGGNSSVLALFYDNLALQGSSL